MTYQWGTKRSALEQVPGPQERAIEAARAAVLQLVIIPAELAAGVSSKPRMAEQLKALRDLTRDDYAGFQERCTQVRVQVQRIKTKCK